MNGIIGALNNLIYLSGANIVAIGSAIVYLEFSMTLDNLSTQRIF